jgi:hypothetical protein
LNFYGYNAGFGGQDYTVSWIDGIGSTRGVIINDYCQVMGKNTLNSPSCNSKLLCQQNNGEVIFKNREGELFDCSAKGVISDTDDLAELRASIQLSPNPATDWLTLRVEGHSGISYRIINALGQIVQGEISISSSDTAIDVSHFPKGIYWLGIISKNQTIFQPFLKQ